MNKKITLYNSQTARNESPKKLTEHIAWLQVMLESIPEEFRGSGNIEMDADEYSLEYEVSYERPETAEELEAKANAGAVLAEKTRREELATLAALKAKYPEANVKEHAPPLAGAHTATPTTLKP